MIYIDMSQSDLGRFPSVSDLDSNRFTKENRDGIVFTYGTTGSYGFLCARAELRRGWIDEGFQRAHDQWPNALSGDDCNTNSGQTGRASCREREWQDGEISVVDEYYKKKI